jgi:hypothetical protein
VRVSDETFEALKRERLERGLPSLDATVAELLRTEVPG